MRGVSHLPRPLKRAFLGVYREWRRWKRLRQADVLLISFAKSGRTWLRTMIGKSIAVHYGIEVDNVLLLDELSCQRRNLPTIVETHDGGGVRARPDTVRGSRLRYHDKKVVFLARDPRDIVVSAYFQASKRKRVFRGTLTEYFYQPIGSFESIIEFFNAWARQRHIPQAFLLVRYEDLHSDPHHELRRILDFVGLEEIGSNAIEAAVRFTSFENMRRLETSGALADGRVLRPGDPSDEESYKTRRGKIGGFIDYFSDADIDYMNRKITRELDPFFGYGPTFGADSDS
jgi:hypothetical protein